MIRKLRMAVIGIFVFVVGFVLILYIERNTGVNEKTFSHNFSQEQIEYTQHDSEQKRVVDNETYPIYSINGMPIHEQSKYWVWFDNIQQDYSFQYPPSWYVKEMKNEKELFLTNSLIANSLEQLNEDEVGIQFLRTTLNEENRDANKIFPCNTFGEQKKITECGAEEINWKIYKRRFYQNLDDNSLNFEYATELNGDSFVIKAKVTAGLNSNSRAGEVSRIIETLQYNILDAKQLSEKDIEEDWIRYHIDELEFSIELPFHENVIEINTRGRLSPDMEYAYNIDGTLVNNNRRWSFLESADDKLSTSAFDIATVAGFNDNINLVNLSDGNSYPITVVDIVENGEVKVKIFDYSRDFFGKFLPESYGIYARPGRSYAAIFTLPNSSENEQKYDAVIIRFLEEDVSLDELRRMIRSIVFDS